MKYTPSANLQDPAVTSELLQIARVIESLDARIITKIYAEPEKPQDGMVVFADGSTWNPGSGEGLYRYDASGDTWAYLESSGGLGNVVEDTTPQLGGNLDAQNNNITDVGTLEVRDAGGTDYVTISHDGTDLNIVDGSGTADIDFEGFTYVNQLGGGGFRVLDSGNTETGIVNMTSTDMRLQSSQHIYMTPGAGHFVYVYRSGQAGVFSVYDGTGNDRISLEESGSIGYLKTTVNPIYIESNTGAIYCFKSGVTSDFRVYHSGGTDYIGLSHDGTDANITCGNTTELNVNVPVKVTTSLSITDGNTKLQEGTSDTLRVQTSAGYLDMGAQNASFAHFDTDRPNFYFGGRVDQNGASRRYNQGAFYHNGSSSYTSGTVTFSTSPASGGTSGDIWFEYT